MRNVFVDSKEIGEVIYQGKGKDKKEDSRFDTCCGQDKKND